LLHYLGAFVLKPRKQMSERQKKLIMMEVIRMKNEMVSADSYGKDHNPD